MYFIIKYLIKNKKLYYFYCFILLFQDDSYILYKIISLLLLNSFVKKFHDFETYIY